jgi:hypothetical protein
MKVVYVILLTIALGCVVVVLQHFCRHYDSSRAPSAQLITVRGEVVDLLCYLNRGATGETHADCAKRCIDRNLPVGITSKDGSTYLIVGNGKPLNSALSRHAAKVITVSGEFSARDGFNMIAKAKIRE